MPQVIAEFYTKTARRSAVVDIVTVSRGLRAITDTIEVSNKRAARRVAAEFNAEPWNF